MEHYDQTKGLSGDSVYALFEDREGIRLGCELQAESTAFVIRESSPSRTWKDWGRMYQRRSSGQQRWHDLGSKRRIA